MEQDHTRRIKLPAVNVVKANSFNLYKSTHRRVSSFSDALKNHVANDQSNKKGDYDGFGV
jgi:hypothetical protein